MNYIYAPYEAQPITYHKGKVKRIKRAKKSEVPQEYRKGKRNIISAIIDEIKWKIYLMKIGGKANV